MRNYDPTIAQKLQQAGQEVEMYGTQVLVKEIPDEPRPGCLDPRELQLVLQSAQWFAEHPDQPDQGPPTVEQQRNGMGFPNLNLNTAEIYTKYVQCDFGGNQVGIWVYYPRKPFGKTGRPGFIYLHGGGWMGGSVFAVENPCRLLAERADCVVFNIDYSLAPEKPFPNGFDDCFHALEYIYAHAEEFGVDREKLGMGGDSAGGNLTAACALRDRDQGTHMLKYQVLIYPAVLLGNASVPGYRWSMEDYEISQEQRQYIEPLLGLGRPPEDGEAMGPVEQMYLQHGESLLNPYISPMCAQSHKGLCPALIAVAEFDGLRIQGEYYGKLLREAGVETKIIRYKGVDHAFLDKLGVLPQAEDLVQEMAEGVKHLGSAQTH